MNKKISYSLLGLLQNLALISWYLLIKNLTTMMLTNINGMLRLTLRPDFNSNAVNVSNVSYLTVT